MKIRLVIVAFLGFALAGAACGGEDANTATTTDSDATAPAPAGQEGQGTTAAAEAGGGDWAVLILANVDDFTAIAAQEKLESAGFEGFVVADSKQGKSNLLKPGLTQDEAEALAAEIVDAGAHPAAFAWEMANLP